MATPLCRCRVLYLGCSVPKVTKDGLQGIQDPLQDIYPDGGAADVTGIDAWLSVWSNGLLLEYLDSMGLTVTKFMPVDTLHYCAAVRFVEVNASPAAASPATEVVTMRFFPLDSPRAASTNHHHPPLFACIMRRTSGIKVLECHGFICKNEIAANALVKACFHAYSDSMNLRLYSDFTPHMIPVIIPKKRSIFKFGKKSRSKSIGPTLIPVHQVPIRSPSPSINLDPYGYNRVYEWRTPTPRPVYLSPAPPTPIHLIGPPPQQQPVPAGDYRYAHNGISSSLNGDNPQRKQPAYQRTGTGVWSSASNSTGAGSDRDVYLYSGSPAPMHHAQTGGSRMLHSRVSSRGEDFYTDILPANRRSRQKSPDPVYGSPRLFGSVSPMTSYQPEPMTAGPGERYYEATTVERKKNGMGKTSRQVDEEHVIYHRRNSANVNNANYASSPQSAPPPPPPPAPYMTELERTLSNGQHLRDRKLSTFKRYDSMPELSHQQTTAGAGGGRLPRGPEKPQRVRELPVLMDGMNLHGSAGSGDRTPLSTPTSTPAMSLSEYYREPRSGKGASPIIPEADYHN